MGMPPATDTTKHLMMKRVIKYVSEAVLIVLMAVGVSSCVYDFISGDSPSDQTDDHITLFIRLGILDSPGTRAEAPDIEKMTTLRIVLLDKEGKVEYNEMIRYGDPVTEDEFILIPTVKGMKKLFFIANEESVTLEGDLEGDQGQSLTSLVEAYGEGTAGFEEAVQAAYFRLDSEKPLPMTSQYEINAGQPGENNFTFYVVPAATKFTFHITNKRTEAASVVKKISIDKLADVNYVMPHVGQQSRNWTEPDGTTTPLYWIDWLKKAVDVTHQNDKVPGNYNENQRIGWIFDYELPGGAKHVPQAMFSNENGEDKGRVPGVGTEGGQEEPEYTTVTFGPYYYPESKSLRNLSEPNGAQVYKLNLELTDGTGKDQSLSREISFVSALFRNTHVVIDIILEMGYMHVYGEIQGWSSNNVFGTLTEEE